MTIQVKSARQAQALVNLSRSPDWKVVAEIIEADQAETIERLIRGVDDAAVHRLQGRAKFVKDLNELLFKAEEYLDRLKR